MLSSRYLISSSRTRPTRVKPSQGTLPQRRHPARHRCHPALSVTRLESRLPSDGHRTGPLLPARHPRLLYPWPPRRLKPRAGQAKGLARRPRPRAPKRPPRPLYPWPPSQLGSSLRRHGSRLCRLGSCRRSRRWTPWTPLYPWTRRLPSSQPSSWGTWGQRTTLRSCACKQCCAARRTEPGAGPRGAGGSAKDARAARTPLTTHHSPLTTHHAPRTTQRWLTTWHDSVLTAARSPLQLAG